MRLGILGGGRAAWAYGSSWRRIGWPIDGVWLRAESQSKLPELLGVPRKEIADLDADLLLVAVSDRAIAEVCGRGRLSAGPEPAGSRPHTLFHASGALP
ncbi:MAG TPA: hypothetical protein VGJ88_04815, partial [Thermoanaerobaculia bacterium]